MNNKKWIIVAVGLLVGFAALQGSGVVTAAYNTILNSGSALPMRPVLNVVNGGCVDNSGANRTDCTFSGGGGGSGSGAGVTVFSGSTVTLLGTQFVAIGGGAAISSTEASVELKSPAAATVSNLSVQLSAALGLAASAVFTWRDGGSSQILTCTIAGATATSCQDTTHSFSAAQGDELDIQVVTTGTPAAATVVIGTQFGIDIGYTTIQNNGTPLTQRSILNFTTNMTCMDDSGNMSTDCSSSGGGSGSFSTAPPYLSDGTHFFVAGTGYQATKPPASPTWINGTTPTVLNGTNGDVILNGTGQYFATNTATASVEAEFSYSNASGGGAEAFIWIYDSTNNFLYTFESAFLTDIGQIVANRFSYTGTGAPSFSGNLLQQQSPTCMTAACHFKLSTAGGTLSFQVSLNGGVTFVPYLTESVGTISAGGYGMSGNGGQMMMDIYSLVVN